MALSVVSGGGVTQSNNAYVKPASIQATPVAAQSSIPKTQDLAGLRFPDNSNGVIHGVTTTSPYQPTAAELQAQQQVAANAKAAAAAKAQQDQYIAQLNGQLGTLDTTQNVGLGNIDSSYNQQYNRLQDAQNQAHGDYDLSTGQNGQQYANTRNGIYTNTRNSANALQRLLGMNGAGNSSAASEQAPYAAGLQGSQDLNSAQTTYGTNQSSLDRNWQNTQKGYSNAFGDLDQQKYSQGNSLKSSIAQTRANILSQISQAGGGDHTAQINSLLSQIAGLGSQYANPVLKAQNVAYQAPTLNDYSLGSHGVSGGANPGTSDVSQNFLGMLAQKKDQFGNPIA